MRKQCSATKRVQSTTLKDARTNIIIALTTGYTKSSRQTQSQVAFVVVSDARCLTVEFHNTFLKQSCAHAVGIENMHHMATGEKCSARINIGIVNMRFGVAEKKIEKRRKNTAHALRLPTMLSSTTTQNRYSRMSYRGIEDIQQARMCCLLIIVGTQTMRCGKERMERGWGCDLCTKFRKARLLCLCASHEPNQKRVLTLELELSSSPFWSSSLCHWTHPRPGEPWKMIILLSAFALHGNW